MHSTTRGSSQFPGIDLQGLSLALSALGGLIEGPNIFMGSYLVYFPTCYYCSQIGI